MDYTADLNNSDGPNIWEIYAKKIVCFETMKIVFVYTV